MKTDRELLELAAKAVGLNVKMIEVDCDDNFRALVVGKKNTKERIAWNPLLEDGDALRLMIKLNMHIVQHEQVVMAQAYYDDMPSAIQSVNIEENREVATRRAIVKAAAAIGGKL